MRRMGIVAGSIQKNGRAAYAHLPGLPHALAGKASQQNGETSVLMNGATLFSGGEGVGIGMRTAGISHLWGIEYDDKIANVARGNGLHTITTDILECDPADLDRPDLLHAAKGD